MITTYRDKNTRAEIPPSTGKGRWHIEREPADATGHELLRVLHQVEALVAARWPKAGTVPAAYLDIEELAAAALSWAAEQWAAPRRRRGNIAAPAAVGAAQAARSLVSSCRLAAELGVSLRDLSYMRHEDAMRARTEKRTPKKGQLAMGGIG